MSVPTTAEVERTIRILELPWHEAMHVRFFYRWSRFKANLTVRLVWWVLVGGAALGFMAFVLLTLAFAIGEVF